MLIVCGAPFTNHKQVGVDITMLYIMDALIRWKAPPKVHGICCYCSFSAIHTHTFYYSMVSISYYRYIEPSEDAPLKHKGHIKDSDKHVCEV